jgi:kinetochore protein Spc7/SPC105
MSGFNAMATIIFPNIKAKAYISFCLDSETFSSWPMLIGATKCQVEVVYGPIQYVLTWFSTSKYS